MLHDKGLVYPMIIDKDGMKGSKLQKSFVIMESYAEEQGLKMGNGVLLSSSGETQELSAGLWRVDVAQM